MKFSKPKGESKPKTAVDKGKFKSKESVSNGLMQKGTKVAAKLVKKGSFNNQLGDLVEVNAKSKIVSNGRQNKKKSASKSLSPEVKLGLELDAMLEKKASKNVKNSDETSKSPLPKRKGKQTTALNKPVVSTEDEPNQTLAKLDSPSKKKRARKLKRKSEELSSPANKQDGAMGTQIDSHVITSPNPQNVKAPGKKRKRRIESENNSSPVKKQDGANVSRTDSQSATPSPQNGKATGKKNKKKNKSQNHSSPIIKQDGNSRTLIDSDKLTPPKPQNSKAAKKNKKQVDSENDSSPVKKPNGAMGVGTDSDGIPSPKPQNDRVAGKKRKNKSKNMENLTKPSVESLDYSLNPTEVEDAIKSLLQVYNEKKSSSKQLLQGTDEPIFISFLFYEFLQKSRVVRFKLNHSLVSEGSDICLFGKDLADTIDKSKTLWNEFLSKEDCTDLVTEVIPLKSLLKDYMQHEYKRKLSNRFDCFLADSRISHRVYNIVGLHNFHNRKRTPTPIVIKEGMTKNNILKAMKRTVSFHKGCSERFSLQIGHTGMTEEQLRENILNVWSQYPKELEYYWENIRRAALFTSNGAEFPIFATLNPPVNGPRPYNMVWSKKKLTPVVGELCNEKDQIVTIYPSGKITLKGGKKLNDDGPKLTKAQRRDLKKKAEEAAAASKKDDSSDDEFGGRNDMIDSDLEDSMMPNMELESDTEDEEEMPPAKKGKKAEKSSGGKQDSKTKAGKKNRKNSMKAKEEDEEEEEEEEDIGEFDVDKAEELYLHDLAAEKKAKAKQMAAGKGKGNKKGPTPADTEEGSDSEGEMDESGFGISSSDEGSDNDDTANEPVFSGKKGNKMANKPQNKGGKQAQQGKNVVKDTKKNTTDGKKVENNPKQKGKLNKSLNKPGAQKNRQQSSPNNSKQTNSSSTNSSPSTSDSGKKKNSFQGVKAEDIKAKKQQKNKMKKLKKKMAIKQKKEMA